MILFKKLKYKNFLSVGDSWINVDLGSHKSTLVIGHNGSGKSLMLDALSFSLFGKPHRNINKPQLVNSINGKGCVTEIEFSIGSKEYKIVRGLKPAIFEIWVDGEMINQESHARDYQKLLETNILKLNHKSFHQIVVLGSGNFIPFMQLKSQDRRGVIEDLLDISIFSKMNAVLKEDSAKLKDQLKDSEYRLDLMREKIFLQTKHIDKLAAISEDSAAKIDSELQDLAEEINVLVQNNSRLLESYQKSAPAAESKVSDLSKKISKLQDLESRISSNVSAVNKELRFYRDTQSCPTCAQTIERDTRDLKIQDCTHKSNELEDGLAKLKSAIQAEKDLLLSARAELDAALKINTEMASNGMLIRNFQKRVTDLHEKKKEQSSDSDLGPAKADLDRMRDERESLSDQKSKLIEDRHYNEVIAELLKDTGIKTKIINQYLPVMNKLINQYLQVLDFFVSFELDENFSEVIKSRYRDEFTYSSFSEGEKSRIDLALLFAWRAISKMKNSSSTNLLILDEVFDGSLDFDGIDNLLKIMGTLDDETRVFVISHKQDVLEGKFDRKLEFEKRKNFTVIKDS